MNPVMYLISDPRIPMSKGKFGAQSGHATQLALELTPDNWLYHTWRWCGGHYAKVVLMSEDLDLTCEYLRERGFSVGKVIDEGRTEFGNKLTTTFLGVQVLDKDRKDVQAVFGQFKLYKDSAPAEPARVEALGDPANGLGLEVRRPFKDWIKERFGYGNTSQRGS